MKNDDQTKIGIPRSLPHDTLVYGVFGFLDAVLQEKEISAAQAGELDRGIEPLDRGRLRRKVTNLIVRTFRLQFYGCPLRDELALFRLYHRDDMADALAHAYGLYKRGQDPLEALTADYCLDSRGLLFWEDIEHLKQLEARGESSVWSEFRRFYRDGDRMIRCRTPVSHGLLLVRGDRLVWEIEELHLEVYGISLRWVTDLEKFEALGGSRAFLAGEFVWPPADWVNPVTDEEEAKSLGKTVRGVEFKP
ncbi:hypothetical protein [Luteolibacter sp. Populi]|uniref:hypothetical protein n=1 Tax=Luteolibacter sp. Populi TaxID=3230487 RepID=UPI003467E9E6